MTITEQDAPVTAAATPPFHRRVVDVLFSPGRLFDALARDPRILGAMLACAVLTAVGAVLIPGEVWIEMMRQQAVARGGAAPPGFGGGTAFRVFGAISGMIAVPLFICVFGGITTGIFAFALGDLGTYEHHLSIMAHAFLIPSIAGVLLVPLKIALSDPTATLNLSLFAVGLDHRGYLFNVLKMLDLFGLWGWLLVAQGMTALDRRRSFASAASILVGLAVVIALIVGAFTRG